MEYEAMTYDALDSIIADRLAARQSKVQQMEQWERKRAWRKPLYAGMVACACIAGLLIVWPMMQPPAASPLDELGICITVAQYRAGSPETAKIERLVAEENYTEATELAQQLLEESDNCVAQLGFLAEDDEMEYQWQLELTHNSELRWTYVCLLVKTEQWSEARRELKLYLKHKDCCEHEAEARQLLKMIKTK